MKIVQNVAVLIVELVWVVTRRYVVVGNAAVGSDRK